MALVYKHVPYTIYPNNFTQWGKLMTDKLWVSGASYLHTKPIKQPQP